MDADEVRRLYMDWFGECRTCKYWDSKERKAGSLALCTCEQSSNYHYNTGTCGHCKKWDPFELELALSFLQEMELNK